VKGSFLIKAKKENIITEKGVRAFVVERLLNSSFSRGSVVNVDKKTVRVQLEGDEKKIKAFIQNLEKEITAEFGNPTITFTHFQENPALEIPSLIRASQALMVGQLEKGITIQFEILDSLKGMSKGLTSEISKTSGGVREEINTMSKGLTSEIRDTSSEIKEEISAMNKGLTEEIRKLPAEIAKAISKQ